MAKTKASSSNQNKPFQKQPVMDASEKLNNLKSLNQILLKETTELRQQVDSLLQSKGCLESAIKRSNLEMETLRSELTMWSESAVSLEVEKNVVSAFIAVELYQVCEEKEEIEVERNGERVKRIELEKVVSGLSETVTSLRNETEKFRLNFLELENESAKSEERRKEMEKEIGVLMEVKKLCQRSIEGLKYEKNMVEKNFEDAMNQLDNEKHKIKDLVSEKETLRGSELGLVREVNILRNRAAERTAFIMRLEKSYKAMEGRSMELSSEFRQCKFELEQVKAERDEIRSCLDKEKQNCVKLQERMENMEKKLEESIKVVMEAKAENGAISVEKMKSESQKREIAYLKASLVEAQNELSSMNVKVVSTDSKSELVVTKLKEDIDTCEHINSEETMANAVEFELIKNAFKCKEAKLDSMKKQVEFLQNSVKEADKKKSFWTVLSSATTLLAAVSLAYASRRRISW